MEDWNAINSRLSRSYERNFELLRDQAKSSKASFLWFAGISGYIIVNVKQLWVDVLGTEFFQANNLNVFFPYVPSVIAVLLAIWTYLRIEDWFYRFSDFNKHFSNAFEALTLERKNAPLLADLLYLDTDSFDEIKKLETKTAGYSSDEKEVFLDLIARKGKSMRSLMVMNRIAAWALWAFFVSFAWAVVGPLVISFCIPQ